MKKRHHKVKMDEIGYIKFYMGNKTINKFKI